MTDTTQEFTIGAAVAGTDGHLGKLTRVVVDPVARKVTHLVIEPRRHGDPSRLVPLGLVETATADEVRLSCGTTAFEQLDPAEESQFVLDAASDPYHPGEVLTWPYFSLAAAPRAYGPGGLGAPAPLPPVVTWDVVPPGEVAIKRGDRVHATDGEIGRVQGLVIDAGDRRVTHVLLQEGHLWDRKQVAIPVSGVAGVDDDGIKLTLTKQRVQDLPPVDIEDPAGRGG